MDDRRARNAGDYAAIDLPDEQQLAGPAPEEALHALEERLGRPLPPSYRAFLALHDGWAMAFGGADLLSAADVDGGRLAERIGRWRRQAIAAGDAGAAHAVVVGAHPATATLLWLDPADMTADGEWAVFLDHHGEEGRWAGFAAWLEHIPDDDDDVDDDD